MVHCLQTNTRGAKLNGILRARVFGNRTSRCIYTRRLGANLILMVRSCARRFEALRGPLPHWVHAFGPCMRRRRHREVPTPPHRLMPSSFLANRHLSATPVFSMALNLPFPTANPDGALRGTYSAEGAFCWSPPVAGSIPINFDVHVNRLARSR